jgi:hypothetical protein
MPAHKKRKPKPKQVKRDSDEFEDPSQWMSSNSEPEDYGNLGDQERWKVDGVVDSHRGENDRMR